MLERGRHPEVEAAEFEAEQPARDLSGLPKLIISTAAVAVSLYALLWVVRPQPAQPYRTSFLAVTLAMTLLAYRPLARGRAASEEERAPEGSGASGPSTHRARWSGRFGPHPRTWHGGPGRSGPIHSPGAVVSRARTRGAPPLPRPAPHPLGPVRGPQPGG